MGDILEELLNSEEEDDDASADDTGDDDSTEEKDEPEVDDNSESDEEEDKPNEQYESLQSKLEEIERQRKGLYKELKGEREKRQELNGRLDQLTNTIQQIIDKRSQNASDNNEAESTTVAGIQVEFTEDGEAFIPKDALASITKPYEEKITALEQSMKSANQSQQQKQAADQLIDRLVSEDERYPDAYRAYSKARTWVNDKVIGWMEDNNLSGEMTSGQALDYVIDDDVEQEFTKRFPGMDIEHVVTAEDSQRLFRRMLNSIATASDDDTTETTKKDTRDDSKVKKLMKKPSGLGSSSNAKAGDLSVADKIADLSTDDILNLSDKQVKELEKALLEEEQAGGIKF